MPLSIVCIGLGYFSHLFADSLNTVPVPWLWPLKRKTKTGRKSKDYVRWFFLPAPLRVTVGSLAEDIFRAVTSLILAVFGCI